MYPFTYNSRPARVIFGSGTVAQLPAEVERLGLKRVLVLSTAQQQGQAEALSASLGERSGGVFAGARMHTPTAVTDEATALVVEAAIDGFVAVGGGSTTGLAKALALRTDLPQIILPTTFAGSEMTPILGETRDGRKVTQSNTKILPEVVIYDVDLTLTMPVQLCVTSGINAAAHAVEALYAQDRNPVVSLMASAGVEALVSALPAIVANPDDRDARGKALYGAWLCGICLGSVGMALHHKLCHTLGGLFDLPHSETHTVILPHALRYNEAAAPEAIAALKSAMGQADPARTFFDLAAGLGAPTALQDLGMPVEGIGEAVEQALENPYWNPRDLEKEALRALLVNAYRGAPP
ncbi:maleylacetate reductase [Sinorhizobium meliloti]|uniref:maleylacetate reductase n=1 Tax=Rhizobium meliloti TaxID=382 RepID=UPI00028619DD|nr:maleylacetate reductase [Sinorhizobium meliloti]ASP83122.1 maleylacetate reductase [Sinorhizobium meliloti]MQW20098.1 iron-containing alcohol dehydrogenase [Sinorhizobium meliloti]CCM69645.1 Maleylacetate reductase [Sinorhizobium meliloti Rm41]